MHNHQIFCLHNLRFTFFFASKVQGRKETDKIQLNPLSKWREFTLFKDKKVWEAKDTSAWHAKVVIFGLKVSLPLPYAYVSMHKNAVHFNSVLSTSEKNTGFAWPGFCSRGATEVASGRSFQRLPTCPTEPISGCSRTDLPLSKAGPVRNDSYMSVITNLRR